MVPTLGKNSLRNNLTLNDTWHKYTSQLWQKNANSLTHVRSAWHGVWDWVFPERDTSIRNRFVLVTPRHSPWRERDSHNGMHCTVSRWTFFRWFLWKIQRIYMMYRSLWPVNYGSTVFHWWFYKIMVFGYGPFKLFLDWRFVYVNSFY